jgi:hypothetical protein
MTPCLYPVIASPSDVNLNLAARFAKNGWLAVVLAIGCLAGCGDDSSPTSSARPDAPLTAQERRSEDRSVAAIRDYCRDVARYLAGRTVPPSPDEAVEAARRIAALARRKPEARYRGTETPRGLAGDLAEDLEGTNCSRLLVAELERGL